MFSEIIIEIIDLFVFVQRCDVHLHMRKIPVHRWKFSLRLVQIREALFVRMHHEQFSMNLENEADTLHRDWT